MAYTYPSSAVSVTIPSGQTRSAPINLPNCAGMVVLAPTTITGVITVEIEPVPGGSTFSTLSSGGSDITIPAGRAVVLTIVGFRQLRLASSAAEAADRTFRFIYIHQRL